MLLIIWGGTFVNSERVVNWDDPRGREAARLAKRGDAGSLLRKLLLLGVPGALPEVGGGEGNGGSGGDSRLFLGVSILAAANRSRTSTRGSRSSPRALRYDPDTRRVWFDSTPDGRLKLSVRGCRS